MAQKKFGSYHNTIPETNAYFKANIIWKEKRWTKCTALKGRYVEK